MKYAILGLIASAAIVLSFQNCKKNANSSDPVSLNSISKIDLAQENAVGAILYFNELQTMQKAAGNYQVISRVALKIDLASGSIEKTSDVSNQPINFCLSDAKKTELSNLLNSFQICKTHHEVAPDSVCTMQYTFPYAEIITSREQFQLGAAANGCPADTIQLCESQDDVLKNYIDSLKSSYQQMNCP